MIREALLSRSIGVTVWDELTTHWAALDERFASNAMARIFEGVVGLDGERADDVAPFIATHPIPQGGPQIEQSLERQRINVAFRATNEPVLQNWLRAGDS